MKNLAYISLAALGLTALVGTQYGSSPRVLAASSAADPSAKPLVAMLGPIPDGMAPIVAPSTPMPTAPTTVTPAPGPKAFDAASAVKGDLVIDFLGAIRGNVEPCG